MASEIRVNKINNRAGLGTITIADTGVVVNGIVTCTEVSGLNVLNIAGVSTFANTLDINGDIDVDGHTNLDNVSVGGATTMSGNLRIQNATPTIYLTDTDNNPDYSININGGHFEVRDVTNNSSRLQILSGGTVRSFGNFIAAKDLDVDGHTNLDNVSIAGVTTFSGNVETYGLGSFKFNEDWSVQGRNVVVFPYNDTSPWFSFVGTNLRFTDGGNFVKPTDNKNANWGNIAGIVFEGTNQNTSSGNAPAIRFIGDLPGDSGLNISLGSGSSGKTAAIDNKTFAYFSGTGHFAPGSDSTYDLGFNSIRWRNLYADTLYGDGSNLTGISGVTINNNANNRIITGSGSANTLNGNTYATWNGNNLALRGGEGENCTIELASDEGDDNADFWRMMAQASDNALAIDHYGSGSWVEKLRITSAGSVYHTGGGNDRRYSFASDGTAHYISFDNTLNGIKLNGYGGITFETNGTNERARIDGSGNFMIGSTSAEAKLDVTGGVSISSNGVTVSPSGYDLKIRSNTGKLGIHIDNSSGTPTLEFGTGNATTGGAITTNSHGIFLKPAGADKLKVEPDGVRSFATFVDTSYHANPDPLGDGSGIAYYRLNYNFQDSGRFGNHGQGLQGGDPTFALVNSSGEPCWQNPTDGAINLPNLKNSYPFSMAAWINVSSWPTTGDNDLIMNLSIGGQRVSLCICCWGSVPQDGADFYIMYGGSGHYYFRPSSKPTNTWIHVVYSVVDSNNTSHRVYQNGADLTTRGNRGGAHGGSAGWAMGGNAGNSERFAIGRIGSIRFFNKALSSSEASALYTNDTFYT